MSVLDNFYTVLEGLDPSYFPNFVLLGDIDFYNPHSPQHCKLTDVMHTFSLIQAVGPHPLAKRLWLIGHWFPRWQKDHYVQNWMTNPAIPRIITWDTVQCAVIPPLANSDHSGLLLQWIWKLPGNQTRLKPRQIWRYAQGDFERAKDMLSSVDWEQLIDPTDVNQSLLTWENYFMNVMESQEEHNQ